MRKFVPSRPTQLNEPESAPREDDLDALLNKVEEKKARKSGDEEKEEVVDAIDVFRNNMRQIYRPVFEELGRKYGQKGVAMELDIDEFLGGGSSIKIRFSYTELHMELEGTVMRGGVAFYIIRGSGSSKGTVLSGPMLRIRNLSAEDFRMFIVEHLSQLIKDALRQA